MEVVQIERYQKNFIFDSLPLLKTPITAKIGAMLYAKKRMKWLLLLVENDDQAPPRCKTKRKVG